MLPLRRHFRLKGSTKKLTFEVVEVIGCGFESLLSCGILRLQIGKVAREEESSLLGHWFACGICNLTISDGRDHWSLGGQLLFKPLKTRAKIIV